MSIIATARFEDCISELTPETIRTEVARFADLLSTVDIPFVRVWCSWNPDLPDDSPLQSPEGRVPPTAITTFFDLAVTNGVWSYGDVWNRAAIEAPDGSFEFFLGNDKNIRLTTENSRLLDATRSAWTDAGYEIYEGDGKTWTRIHPQA